MENRCKFPVQVVRRIREVVGKDFIIEVRISGEEHLPGGYTKEDALVFCKLVEPYADIIHVSAGWINQAQRTGMYSNMYADHFCNLDAAAFIKHQIKIPVSVVGGINDPEQADKLIADGMIDFIALGRQVTYADPEFANKCKAGQWNEINRCTRCGCCGMGDVPHSAPLSAFVTFLLGIKILLNTVRSVGSVRSKSRMGHGLGQAETVSSKKPRTGWD